MRWLFWNASHWNAACSAFVFERLVKPALNLGAPDAAKIADGEERFQRFGTVLNHHLEKRSWISGERLSLADFGVGAMLVLADQVAMPWQQFDHIQRWWDRVSALEAWQRTA
jgi:glutathione S-transferase